MIKSDIRGLLAGAQSNAALCLVRHKHVLEDFPKPSELCRVSGRNGGQFRLHQTAHAKSTVDKWDNVAFRPVAARKFKTNMNEARAA